MPSYPNAQLPGRVKRSNDGAGVDAFSGQTVTGNVCFQIASNDADSLALDVADVWFALR